MKRQTLVIAAAVSLSVSGIFFALTDRAPDSDDSNAVQQKKGTGTKEAGLVNAPGFNTTGSLLHGSKPAMSSHLPGTVDSRPAASSGRLSGSLSASQQAPYHPTDKKPYQVLADPQTISDPASLITLRAGGIDTNNGPVNVPENLRFDISTVLPGDSIRYLVQFSGPVLPEWKEAVTGVGAEFGEYLPNNAFIISMSTAMRRQVESFGFIKWTDYYHPAYKLSAQLDNDALLALAKRDPGARHFSTTGHSINPLSAPEMADTAIQEQYVQNGSDPVLVTVQTFSGGTLPYLYNIADAIEDCRVLLSSSTRKSRVVLEFPEDQLDRALVQIAQAHEVEWIEPFIPPELNNDAIPWVVQGGSENLSPIWDQGITGGGQIVGIGDTGLDIDMAYFWDAIQGIPNASVNLKQRKVISYHDLAGNGDWDSHDHGTHVAGTVAGKSTGPNEAFNGIAFDAKLVIQDIGSGGSLTGIPADLNIYFQQA